MGTEHTKHTWTLAEIKVFSVPNKFDKYPADNGIEKHRTIPQIRNRRRNNNDNDDDIEYDSMWDSAAQSRSVPRTT